MMGAGMNGMAGSPGQGNFMQQVSTRQKLLLFK